MTRRVWLAAVGALLAHAGDWGPAAQVIHDDDIAIAYQARVDGQWLVVRAKVGPGWHTFAMDNKRRADEKLAGKPALSVDRATEIAAEGIAVEGPWYQTPPKDFSRPELRWFSWGFENEAVFAAKVRKAGAGKLTVKGQACTETVCKNIDVAVTVPGGAGGAGFTVKDLVVVR
jgi:hypothetical protein